VAAAREVYRCKRKEADARHASSFIKDTAKYLRTKPKRAAWCAGVS
jgi:hypothetical protein